MMHWRRIAGLWRRRSEDADLLEEIEFHRASIQADLESRGMTTGEARDASRRAMGNVVLAREDAREVWIWRWADQLVLDVRCGMRNLRQQPLVSLAALFATALGVATTTTVFSVADSEIWKPLPYPEPSQLVVVVSRGPSARASNDGVSGADLLEWRGAQALADIAISGNVSRRVLQRQTAESVLVDEVTANYFSLLGRPAIAGRTFAAIDAIADRRLIVTGRAWKRLFSSDPSIVGRSVQLDETPAVIVGIVATDDHLGRDPDFFLAIDESAPGFLDVTKPISYGAIGRLRPGTTAAGARAQLESIATATPARKGHHLEVKDLGDYYAGNNRRPLYFFLGASLIVLLLGTINVATLLLSRAMRRAPEFALRRALGGGEGALARQLFVEGVLLAAAGGGLGILFASWAIRALSPLVPSDLLFRGSQISIDARVAAFSIAATAIATIVFGLVPLPLARRTAASEVLRSGGRAGRPAHEGRARSALLTVQVALTLVLLAGAAIFLKSFIALTHMPLGFEPDNVAALRLTLSGARFANDDALRAYSHRLLDAASAVPGAQAATVATSGPFGSGPQVLFARTGQPRPQPGEEARAILRSVGVDYFKTMGTRVIRGRTFSADDTPGAMRVAIINTVLAARLFGDADPIGQLADLLPARTPWTNRPGPLMIVGVAANIKEVGFNEVEFGDVYVPFEQMPAPRIELLVRTATPPDVTALRAVAAGLDPLVPVTSAMTFSDRVDEALAEDKLNLAIVVSFAAVAILLSALGVYAAAAYHVQARTREFGLRLALGGSPRTLVAAAVWQTARPALIGGSAGILLVLVLARMIGNALYLVAGSHNGLLFGVTTTDPAALLAAFCGLLSIAIVAAVLPARQVARIDPMATLNAE